VTLNPLYTDERTVERSIRWHSFNVTAICLRFCTAKCPEDDSFCRNMKPFGVRQLSVKVLIHSIIYLHSLFSVIPLILNFKWRRFGTSCLFQFHRWCKQLTAPTKKEQNVPKRQHKFQTPGNNPKEIIQHLQNGESFKSRSICLRKILSPFLISKYKNRLSLRLEVDKKYSHSQIDTKPRTKPDPNQPP
jgi:hypothetical protein